MKEGDAPSSPASLLSVENLVVEYRRAGGGFRAVDRVDFEIKEGETLGLVGESGCGKSTIALALLRLLPPGATATGTAKLAGRDLLGLSAGELREVRGGLVGMIFQEPTQSMDPLMSISSQMVEAIRVESEMTRSAAKRQALELLEEVGIQEPSRCLDSYPHQLSGGMAQRVLIAMALSRSPRLLIGDEPTSALDTSVQARILALLERLRETRRLSMLLISHDFGVVAQLADRVAVMREGQIVESAPVASLFNEARHPYTRQLLAAIPGEWRGE